MGFLTSYKALLLAKLIELEAKTTGPEMGQKQKVQADKPLEISRESLNRFLSLQGNV